MADFLLALADFHAKLLWRDLGHTSLFYYLRRELGLSAGAAQHRKTAVELVQEYPAVEAALREGRLCLSSVCELAKIVTPENVAQVLPRFFGLSRREAEVVAASIRPAPVVPEREVVTPLPTAVRAPELESGRDVATVETASHPVHPSEMPVVLPTATAAPARPPDSVQPLTAELSRYHITVSREFMETLEQTREALSHSHPGASTEEILMVCMQLMLERKAKQKGLVEKPLETPRPSRPGYIPAHVRREVMKRSGGRCEWTFESGERCSSTHQIEVDHIDPKALGGPATVANTRALCKGHNQLAARRIFGDKCMDRYARTGTTRHAARPNRSVRTNSGGETGTRESG